MASRNRKNVKKRGPSKLSLPPLTPPSQAPSQGSEQEAKKDNKPSITSPGPYIGPEGENGSEEISPKDLDGHAEFRKMRYVDVPTELQMKVTYWNDYLVSPATQLPSSKWAILTRHTDSFASRYMRL